MRRSFNRVLGPSVAIFCFALFAGCSPAEGGPAWTTGGSPGNTGGTNSTGGAASGGVNTGGVSTGGVSTGGVTTGGISTGGVSTGGISTGGVGTGGTSATTGGLNSAGSKSGGGTSTGGGKSNGGSTATGGSSASTGGAGGSGTGGSASTGTPTPSAGCSKGSKGTKISKANEEIVDFPPSYDGAKPFPMLMMLHACGNPNTQWENLVSQRGPAGLSSEYVRWMPNTTDSGQCWSNYANNIKRITQQYDELLANYCIDTSRVFGVGHSSGAQMLVNILSHKADADHLALKGVAPVAADPYNVASPMPVLYIDGQMDNQRSATSATNTVARFRTANKCAETSKAYAPIMACKSYQNQAQVDPGCKIYDNCVVPTIWCAHNDPDYSNTQHGVPCFALQAMYDFFKTL